MFSVAGLNDADAGIMRHGLPQRWQQAKRGGDRTTEGKGGRGFPFQTEGAGRLQQHYALAQYREPGAWTQREL